MVLSGCDARDGLATIGRQDRPSEMSYRVTGTITVGKRPSGVAVDPSTHTVYVANSGDDTVSMIDPVSRTVTASIAVGDRPQVVAVDPAPIWSTSRVVAMTPCR